MQNSFLLTVVIRKFSSY